MSERIRIIAAEELQPWQQSVNGLTWCDMPGQDFLEKSLNFALWRRGKLDVEMDGETRRLRCVKSCFTGAVLSERGKRERAKREARNVAAREVALVDEQWRARLRLRLTALKAEHLGALHQLAAVAGVNYDNVLKFVREGSKLGTERLKLIEAKLVDFVPTVPVRGRKKPAVVPPGHVPFGAWLRHVADKQGIKPHTVYVQVQRGLIAAPEIFKVNGRAWFVNEKEVAA